MWCPVVCVEGASAYVVGAMFGWVSLCWLRMVVFVKGVAVLVSMTFAGLGWVGGVVCVDVSDLRWCGFRVLGGGLLAFGAVACGCAVLCL